MTSPRTGPTSAAGGHGRADDTAALTVPVVRSSRPGEQSSTGARVDLRSWACAFGVSTGAGVEEEVSRLRVRLLGLLGDLVAVAEDLDHIPEADLRSSVLRAAEHVAGPHDRLVVVRRAAAEHLGPLTDPS